MFTVIFTMISLTNLWLASKMLVAIRKFSPKISSVKSGIADTPSVSVLIAARNEQSAMSDCLDRILASNYPKLEIIVLDDNSVDNTSEMVKNFAQRGVRFIRGEEPPKGWLGRNYAYHRLSQEASGDILVFLSVDTKLSRESISLMVGALLQGDFLMMSFLPTRADNYRSSVIFSSLRYFNELVLANDKNPPSSSSAWLIRSDELIKIGGFEKFKRSILPEKSIAKAFENESDFWQEDFDLGEDVESQNSPSLVVKKYGFMIDGGQIGVNFEKRWSSQIQTARRNFALKIHKNKFAIFTIIPMILHFLPFVWTGFLLLLGQIDTSFWLLLAQVAISGAIYAVYASVVWTRGWWLGMIIYPAVLLQEILIFISAIYMAFFGRIIWRGREINFRKF